METSNGVNQPNMTPQTPPSGGNGAKIVMVVLVVLIILALAWYFVAGKKGSDTSVKSGQENAGMMQTSNTSSQPMSMKELMASGKTQKCDFTSQSASSTSQGTVYIGGGKMRGDFSSTAQGKTMATHMINDGTTVYTWVDGMSMAVKMSAAAKMTNRPTPSNRTSQSVDQNAKYNYNCSDWTQDNSQFTPPANINFTDMSAMMQQNTTTGTSGSGASAGAGTSASMKAQQCAACDGAGAGKAQCLAMLKCN